MKTLYLECNMGASGDMIMGALWELLDEVGRREFLKEVEKLKPLGIEIKMDKASKCGIFGTKARVSVHGKEEGRDLPEETHQCHSHESDEHSHEGEEHHDREEWQHSHGSEKHNHNHDHGEKDHNHYHEYSHGHCHRSLGDIQSILKEINLPLDIKGKAMEVYTEIALAEAKVHNKDIDKIHFHEVGDLDAIADVVCCLSLFKIIGADKVIASPVATGRGFVKCAHGTLPVPAPATALILRGIPMYYGDIEGELCTPTGAAILKNTVDEFKVDGVITVGQIGYGLGNKDFDKANVLRAILLNDEIEMPHESGGKISEALELSLNIDDMTGEELGFAMEELMEIGALDCWAEPIFMKKNRPAYKISVLALKKDRDKIIKEIFKHTKTIGIRENKVIRYMLDREEVTVKTALGDINKKISTGFDVNREKLSYEDLKAIAKEKNLSLEQVKKRL